MGIADRWRKEPGARLQGSRALDSSKLQAPCAVRIPGSGFRLFYTAVGPAKPFPACQGYTKSLNGTLRKVVEQLPLLNRLLGCAGPHNCGCSPGVSYLRPENIHAAGILSAAGPRRARTSLAAGTWRFLPEIAVQHLGDLRFLPIALRDSNFLMWSGANGILHEPTKSTATVPMPLAASTASL
jgi:hypothetical protein